MSTRWILNPVKFPTNPYLQSMQKETNSECLRMNVSPFLLNCCLFSSSSRSLLPMYAYIYICLYLYNDPQNQTFQWTKNDNFNPICSMYGIYIYINKYPKDDAVVYTVLSENRIPHYIHWLYNQKMTVCLGESPISKQSQLSYDCWLHIFHCILTIIPLYYYLNTSKYQFSLPFPNSRLCFIIILPWLSHDYFCTRHIYSIYIYIYVYT